MERLSGLPLEILFEHNFVVNGPPILVQFPSGWRANEAHEKKMKQNTNLFDAKIKVLSIIARKKIPLALKDKILLVTVDELPPTSLAFSDSSHAESLPIPMLTSIHVYQKSSTSELKMKLYNSGGTPLYPERTVTKLSVALRSFPFDTNLSTISFHLQFHVQLH